MPAPIENAIRSEIIQRHQSGESLRSISEELKLSYHTVKKLWQHWRKGGKIEPNYEQAKRQGTRQFGGLYAPAIALKTAHPRWGAPLILLELQQTIPCSTYPTPRTLQRWFRQAGVNRAALVKQRREKFVKRGQAVHQVWAVDAKEQIPLGDGSQVSWLTVSDEASGAILHTEVFPPGEMGESGS
jgi:hypothetical protein